MNLRAGLKEEDAVLREEDPMDDVSYVVDDEGTNDARYSWSPTPTL